MSISSVTSEALQLKLRQLLPSQQGFGTDLSASDTIIPVIDLTASAEGSDVRQDLQTALAFGSQTSFGVFNTTATVINTTGFYRVFGMANLEASAAGQRSISWLLNDGASTKNIWVAVLENTASAVQQLIQFDFVVFIGVGESLQCTSTSN